MSFSLSDKVELSETDIKSPVIELPEVFVPENLVFEVRIDAGGLQTTQQLTVQVDPVEDVARPLDTWTATRVDTAGPAASDQQETKPGIGKVWASLLAFLQTGRRR